MLWIAFIYRIFALWKQPGCNSESLLRCCELLSFIVSLLFENSKAYRGDNEDLVVNCFHLSYLCSLKTALDDKKATKRELWIAFIYRIFALWKQLVTPRSQGVMSCELLSFIVSLLFENSHGEKARLTESVVNCFHLSYLCSLKTAEKNDRTRRPRLWIAFIYRIFALWKQRLCVGELTAVSCELLSFIVSLLFENSTICINQRASTT